MPRFLRSSSSREMGLRCLTGREASLRFSLISLHSVQPIQRIAAGFHEQMQPRISAFIFPVQLHAALRQSAQKLHVARLRSDMVAELPAGIPPRRAGPGVKQRQGGAVDVPLPRGVVAGKSLLRQKEQRERPIAGSLIGLQPLFQQPGDRFRVRVLAGDVQQIGVTVAAGRGVERTLLIHEEDGLWIRVFLIRAPDLHDIHVISSFPLFEAGRFPHWQSIFPAARPSGSAHVPRHPAVRRGR